MKKFNQLDFILLFQTGYTFREMSHVILHPLPGREDHRIAIPRNLHYKSNLKYDNTGMLTKFEFSYHIGESLEKRLYGV